jgi:hypothetical protein
VRRAVRDLIGAPITSAGRSSPRGTLGIGTHSINIAGQNLYQRAFRPMSRIACAYGVRKNAFHRLQISDFRADLRHKRGGKAPRFGADLIAVGAS